MTVLGVVFILIFVLGILGQRNPILFLLIASVPLQSAAVASFAGQYVSAFYAASILLLMASLVGSIRVFYRTSLSSPERWFCAFLLVAILTTLIGPHLFSGMPVFSPSGGISAQVGNESRLTFSSSNVAQVGYLLLGLTAAIYVARSSPPVFFLKIALWLGLVAGLVRHYSRNTGLSVYFDSILDNRTDRNYSIFESRARGTFSEPSDFGTFCLVSTFFFLAIVIGPRRKKSGKVVDVLALSLSLWGMLLAQSGTVFAAFPIIVVFFFLTFRQQIRGDDRSRLGWNWIFGGAILLLLVVNSQRLAAYFLEGIGSKIGTDSFSSRNAANSSAWSSFLESFGFGIGLGSTRPSSLAFTVLAATGIFGAIFFSVAIYLCVRLAMQVPETGAAGIALFALIICKLVAGPDLSTPMLWVLIGFCLSAAIGRDTALGVSRGRRITSF